jgi:hypothetical protein
MVVLLAPWSCIQLKLVKLGQAPEPQFGIFAKQDIPAKVPIYELAGLLSSDSVDGDAKSKTTSLSEMYGPNGSTRVLFGPIRFVNHSCGFNSVVSCVHGTSINFNAFFASLNTLKIKTMLLQS